jgi:hypothetical protein
MIIFSSTCFQVSEQICQLNFIGLCNILERAKPLQKTANAVRAVCSEHPHGLGPSLQAIFNRVLRLENLCVHLPQRYLLVKDPSLRQRK